MCRFITLLSLVVALGACATPISVTRMDSRTVYQDLTRNVLSTGEMSAFSRIILNRADLAEEFAANPEGALADLHTAVAKDRLDLDHVFALAELSFLHAERTRQPAYFLAAAVYAYAFLFPPPDQPRAGPEDPRYRLSCDLYNHALTAALRSKDGSKVVMEAESLPLPLGSVDVAFDSGQLRWVNRTLSDFTPIADLDVQGLRNRYRHAGLGTPLAATADTDAPTEGSLVAAKLKVPVTAFLRIEDTWAYFRSGHFSAVLELHVTLDTETIRIEGRELPLETEPTATLAYMLSKSGVWDYEFRGFLFGEVLRDRGATQLIAIDPYRRGRIPVIFVHGTASSPARWAEMFNELQNDPRIRHRYQFWFFAYETGNPVLYSAMRLREALQSALATLDPGETDSALRQMVLIGHSQGGLLVKLMVVDLEDQIRGAFFPEGFDQSSVSEENRDLLNRLFAVRPLPFVRQAIFMATPHRGSYVAGSWLAHQIGRFVRMPGTLLKLTTEALTQFPELSLAMRGQYGSVYAMTPGSPLIKALAPAPLADGVMGHSIIAVDGDQPLDDAGDGVVRYTSAHLDGMASELIVQSGHSVQADPEAIEEVRRILLEHAAAVLPQSENVEERGVLPSLFRKAPPRRQP